MTTTKEDMYSHSCCPVGKFIGKRRQEAFQQKLVGICRWADEVNDLNSRALLCWDSLRTAWCRWLCGAQGGRLEWHPACEGKSLRSWCWMKLRFNFKFIGNWSKSWENMKMNSTYNIIKRGLAQGSSTRQLYKSLSLNMSLNNSLWRKTVLPLLYLNTVTTKKKKFP